MLSQVLISMKFFNKQDSFSVNFIFEKYFFHPKINWMKKAKLNWEIENIKVRLEKKISIIEAKENETQPLIQGYLLS